eukprot:768429-Hanusia_phi.AAC.13
MAEFDPEAYMDQKLGRDGEGGEGGEEGVSYPSEAMEKREKEGGDRDGDRDRDRERDRDKDRDRDRDRERDRDSDRKRSKRDRSRSRSKDKKRSRSRSRDRRDRDRHRDKHDDRRRHDGEKRRYDETYRYEKEIPDRLPAEQIAKDDEGFDRDMRTIFVAQVARKADERDLFQFFSEAGKVVDVRIIKDTQTRRSKGIAYVEFEKQEQCVAAVQMSGQLLCGFPVVVQASQAEKNQAARLAAQVAGELDLPAKLSVENLHMDIAEDDLQTLFSPFGKVLSVRINKDHGRSTGKGVVEFKTLQDAQKAVAHLNGFDLAGKALNVRIIQSAGSGYTGSMNSGGGPATEMLDDNEIGGVHVSAQSRHSLMQKLARGDAQLTSAVPNSLMSGALQPSKPANAIPNGQSQPSVFMVLVNMFDPAKETEPDFHIEIQDDVKEECEAKFGKTTLLERFEVPKSCSGRVIQVVADRKHPNGLVYVRFDSTDSAQKA